MEEKREEGQEEQKPQHFTVTDKRFWVKKEEEGNGYDGKAPPKSRYPTYVEDLLSQLEEKDRLLKEYIGSYKKLKDENEEFKKRLLRDLERRVELSKANLVTNFLEVLDNLERAIASAETQRNFDALLQGIRLIQAQFLGKLRAEGVEEINTLKKPFDPAVSEAVEVVMVEEQEKDNRVVSELEKGYLLNERVIRPAKVKVGKVKGEE
ncbi:MAG: nucleotide exchange factor GrpE [Candidatus Tectomicrobia bacterium]|nr:nucleotide exchange factor GrpE [Candidatus Tectomicrobia bacterium]